MYSAETESRIVFPFEMTVKLRSHFVYSSQQCWERAVFFIICRRTSLGLSISACSAQYTSVQLLCLYTKRIRHSMLFNVLYDESKRTPNSVEASCLQCNLKNALKRDVVK